MIRATGRAGAPRRVRLELVRAARSAMTATRWGGIEVWAWTGLVVWMTAPLPVFLSHLDPALPADQVGTPLYRYARYAAAMAPLTVLLHQRRAALRVARAAWPLLALMAYAAASCLWSQDRASSLHGLLAGAPTLATAAALAVALRPERVAQVLLQALATVVLGSVAAVVLLPHYAVAGPHDLLGASAPGDWRGLYGHKNTLGHVAGLAVGVLAAPGGRLIRSSGLRWSGLIAALACVVASHSASGLALAVALPLLDRLRRSARGSARLIVASLILAGLAAAAFAAVLAGRAMILTTALSALGRDTSFSGRTAIWRAAAGMIRRRMLAGWGLDYSISPEVAGPFTARFGVNHVHNALLDVALNLGGTGVVLLILAVAGALAAARWTSARIVGGPRATAARDVLVLLSIGWLLSGLTEDMAVRADGPLAEVGVCALFGLYGLQAAGSGRLDPALHPAWRVSLRRARWRRLPSPRPGRSPSPWSRRSAARLYSAISRRPRRSDGDAVPSRS